MTPILETTDLSKTYGAVRALDGIDLSLAPGEILGFVGPNGAGKSTFMKILLGVCRPTRGRARVFGVDAVERSIDVRARVGYLPGDLGVYRNLTGRGFLEFCLSFHPGADRVRASDLAERFGLPLGQRVKGYSTGMRQKLGLVQALAVGGELLLLDEPTKGLDPTSQVLFLDLLREENAAGRSILLSSHVLEEIERTCHRIVFIERGRLIDPGVIDAARERFRRELRVTFDAGANPDLATVPGVRDVVRQRDRVVLHLDGPLGPALARLAELDVRSIEYNRPSLQDVYREVYLGREEGAG
ncbi:MAG: ATP-binding cassette domain-containing protein [Planctomycetota bacterium JB042]